MSAAAIGTPRTASPQLISAQVPLFTRYTLGATEAARDHRLQDRDHGVHRYTSARTPVHVAAATEDLDRWNDDGGRLPSDPSAAVITR